MTDQAGQGPNEKISGLDCPFDEPRGDLSKQFIFIAKLQVSTLYLERERNRSYRGYCVLVYDPRHVARINELSLDEWHVLATDIHRAHSAIVQACSPAHMNLASLGNAVRHIHWHLIPRYLDDPNWGDTIWSPSDGIALPKTLTDEDYREIAESIAKALGNLTTDAGNENKPVI
jgi:diadenosine tetraphosphate (Ap4A) HIT family hydrolase